MMHVGRMSHPDNTPHHHQAAAPSAISADQEIFTPTGPQKTPTPRELSMEDIQTTVAEFRHAAASAIVAGADGVEIHGANGYLLHQFLSPNANHRTDAYGGSVENRSRFVIELAQALAEEIGADRVGIRLSPAMPLGGIDEGDTESMRAQYRHLIGELAALNLAYLHLHHVGDDELLRSLREAWPLNEVDPTTLYGGGASGYTDYPALAHA
jgi:N-ethylmaleimide reductase